MNKIDKIMHRLIKGQNPAIIKIALSRKPSTERSVAIGLMAIQHKNPDKNVSSQATAETSTNDTIPPGDQDIEEDGGPGSGNWGHKGRPGQVGGSGKGGGKQYRGGRGDITYVSSKHDWLNGLTGEKQHEAQSFMKRMKQAFPLGEEKNRSTEENILRETEPGILKTKKQLTDYMAEARSWDEKAGKLIDENLDDTDKKYIETLANKYGMTFSGGVMLPDESDIGDWDEDDQHFWYDLKSKAMGGPTSGRDAPDELQYEAGIKERPNRVDFGWVDHKNRRDVQRYLVCASGGKYYLEKRHLPNTNEGLDKLEEAAMRHVFTEQINQPIDRYEALDNMSRYLRAMGRAKAWDSMVQNGIETIPNLSDEEKNDLAEVVKSGRGKHNLEDFDRTFMTSLTYDRTGEGQMAKMDLVQRYLFYKAKALGHNPPGNPMDKKDQTEKTRARVQDQIKADFPKRKGTYDKTLHNKIENAKNTKQVIQAIKDSGFFKAGGKISVGSANLETAKGIAHSLNRICTTFPFMKGELASLKTAPLKNGTMAQCSVSYMSSFLSSPTLVSMNDLSLASAYFKKDGPVVESYEDDVRIMHHPQGTHYDSILTHELGHAIDNYLSSRGVLGGQLTFSSQQSYIRTSHYIKQAVMQRIGGNPDIKQELSGYGAKNDSEWFAECIAEYFNSPSPRRMATMCVEELEKAIRQEGLTYNG